MKKITRVISIVFAFILVFVLASCSDKSGVTVEKSTTATTNSITFNLTFAENSNISSKLAVPHIKLYSYSESAEEHVGDYLSQDKSCSFENSVYTSSTVTFTSLTKDTKYAFRFYVTYNQEEELLATWIEATSNDNAKEISTKDEFLAITSDPSGDYTLKNDIDFGGAEISGMFTSESNPFKGTFDGNGYALKNFKFASSNFGLFSYTENAVIKNLKVIGSDEAYCEANKNDDGTVNELINGDYSAGRSNASIGILIGKATKTEVIDVTIDNVNLSIKGNSSAELNIGGVVGKSLDSSFTNVHATNVSIDFSYVRRDVCAGLFAGSMTGDGLKTENGTYTAKNTSAEGEFTGTLYYTTAEGFAYIGGYAGDLGSSGLVSDSYVEANIVLYRDTTSTNLNKFVLAVGGFAGANLSGSMFVKGCVAATDILVRAGSDTTTNDDAALSKLSSKIAYIGGFVAVVNKHINTVKDSCYVKRDTGINVFALASETDDDNNEKILYKKDNVCATTYDVAKLENVVCVNDNSFDTSVLDSKVAKVVEKYLQA